MTKSLHFPRLPARPTWWGDLVVYYGLVRPALRRMFSRVLLDDTVLQATPGVLTTPTPVLCYALHPSWWDGYLALELFRNIYPRNHFLMMEEAQLRRYFFFRWEGCFSVDRADAREGLRSVHYAAHLLRTVANPLVWVFPQGLIRPADQRPLVLYRGVAEIATRTDGVWCLPLALRYEFSAEEHPQALIRLGTPHWADRHTPRATLQAQIHESLTTTADSLREAWQAGNLAAFRSIVTGRVSVNQRFDALVEPWKRWWLKK